MAYRMTPARRRALRKAQLASARKRRGTGSKKLSALGMARTPTKAQRTRRRKIVRGVAVGAAVGVAAYQANYHARYVTGYHRTSYANRDQILRTQSFKSMTHTRKVEGSDTGIWFSRYRRMPLGAYKPFGATNQNFGPAVVKVKRIPRKVVTSHRKVMKDYGSNSHARDWFMVDSKDLKGKKIKGVANPMTKRYRAYKRNAIATRTSFPGFEHMAYLTDNWADPKPRTRRRRRRK